MTRDPQAEVAADRELIERLRAQARDRAQMDAETPGVYRRAPRMFLEWRAADRIEAALCIKRTNAGAKA